MKQLITTLIALAGFAFQAFANDFQSGDLLYTIISIDPPCVSLDGHIDGQAAQGELVVPATVEYNNTTFAVTKIDIFAFYKCTGLTSLVLGERIETIGRQCFEECSGLTGDLILPNTITEIEANAFYNCSSFDGRLVLSENLTEIGTNVFSGCGFTGDLVIPERVATIRTGAFSGCRSFSGSLVIPNSVTLIDDLAFESCSGFNGELVIGKSVQFIGGNAFAYCSGFTGNLTIPNSVTVVGDGAFTYCSGFNGTLSLPSNLNSIGRCAFKECGGISGDLIIPNGVIEIGWSAFENCTSLTGHLEVPNSIRIIEHGTFKNCGFNSITLGGSILEIHGWAFEDINLLQTMTIKATTPPAFIEAATIPAFENVPKDIPVYVPCGSLEAYRNAEGWCEFTNLHESLMALLSVVSADETAGTVRILKEATCEDNLAQVEAMPNEGHSFLYWEANGEQVSSENIYSFELEEDTELVAHFSGMDIKEEKTKLSVYPNPTTGIVTITGKDLKQAEVLNTLGQRVATATGEGERITIDISSLPTGIYFINITDTEGRKCVRKVVKK